jgi:parallel beta-helix repeat protein
MTVRAYVIGLALILYSLTNPAFIVHMGKSTATIYIRADGSVHPPDAPIASTDNVTYTFTGNVNDSIVIERDNITIDGAGHTLQGNGKWAGVNLTGRRNVTIKNMEICNFYYGIYLYGSTCITLFNNSVKNNEWDGIYLLNSIGNALYANTISSNKRYGIMLSESSNNKIIHNNFIDNANPAYTFDSFNNVWNDDYPSGGNYWSNYVGIDLYNGSNQNETGGDGIGDTTCVIDSYNRDDYPLMGRFNTFVAEHWDGVTYNIDVVSNSSVSNFKLTESIIPEFPSTISLNVSGPDNTVGFCRITIPNIIVQDLWRGSYTVLLNGQPWPFSNWTDIINTYIYINYTHSTHEITIMPEFPSTLTLAVFTPTTLIATALLKTRRKTKFPNFP